MGDKFRVIYDRDEECRLDKFLVELRVQELYSRSFIEKLIENDNILVNSIPVKKSFLLKAQDIIDVHLLEPEPLEIVPQNIPLEIVYEDEWLAVINKPAGMIVHPGYGNPDNTLVNAVVYRYGENLSSGKSNERPGIVHRLDRGTSGLIIVAKSDLAQSVLSEMFAKRQVKKIYLAITTGIPEPPEDSIETCISRSIKNPRKMVVSESGRWALTQYRIIRYYNCFALLEVNLETGRMHQIRVHLSHRNYPILGDLLYNSIRAVQAITPENMKRKVYEVLTSHLRRQALHAWKLSFTHPFTSEEMEFTAPLPEDLIYTLDWLEQYFAIDNQSYRKLLFIGENHAKE